MNHWYVDVQNPPQQLSHGNRVFDGQAGQFYCLARSNTVTTPPAGTSDSIDENWADIDQNADRIFAMSGGYSDRGTSLELQELLEERLRRPMGTPMQTRYGGGASRAAAESQELPFAVDAELIVYGVSHRMHTSHYKANRCRFVRMAVYRADVVARSAAGDSGHRQLAGWRRAADDYPSCRAEYEGAGRGRSRSGGLTGMLSSTPRLRSKANSCCFPAFSFGIPFTSGSSAPSAVANVARGITCRHGNQHGVSSDIDPIL